MNIYLTQEQEKFIISQIEKGQYQTPQEIISEALRLLEEYNHQKYEGRLKELRQKIAIASEEIKQGKVTDGEVVFEQLQERWRLWCGNWVQ